MFCNHCGAQLDPASNFCRACGKPITGVPLLAPAPMSEDTRYQRRLHLLSMSWMALGGLFLIPSLTFVGFGHGFHTVFNQHGPFFPFSPFAFLFGGGFAILAIGTIVIGYGLMHHLVWARIAAIVVGIIFLFHPPFGTALGAFSLIILLSRGGSEYYARASNSR